MGLNYIQKDKLRSQVLVKDDSLPSPSLPPPPPSTSPRLTRYKDWPSQYHGIRGGRGDDAAVDRLTKVIQQAIEAQTINAESWDELMIIDLARQIYSVDYELSLAQHVEIVQRFADTYRNLKGDPKVQQLKVALERYKSILDTLGLKDAYFSHDYQRRLLYKSVLVLLLRLFFAALLAVPGYLIHFPLHYIGRKANASAEKETAAQTKFVTIVVLLPLWYLLVWALVWLILGRIWLLVALVALPVIGFMHAVELQEGKEYARSLVSTLRLLHLLVMDKKKIDDIRALRSGISNGINEFAVKLYGEQRIVLKARRLEEAATLDSSKLPSLRSFHGAAPPLNTGAS